MHRYLLLFPCLAFAQTPISSIRNVADSDVLYAITVTPLSSTGPLPALSQEWPASPSFTYQTDFIFPASLTAYTLVGFNAAISPRGTGFLLKIPASVDVAITPLQVPAGTTVLASIFAPLSGLGSVVPVLGPIPPPPPPPPAPVCVRIPPVSPATGEVTDFTPKIVDGAGAVWTIAPRVVPGDTVPGQVTLKRNGAQMFGGIEYAYRVNADLKTPVCVADFKSGPGRSCFNGTGWTAAVGAATGACP